MTTGLISMRVVSLVPSWTETLIEAGVDVVGRTRFCIHPENRGRNIKVVGGTKDVSLDKIRDLKPDLILLDREENTKEMAEDLGKLAPLHVTNVRSVEDMPNELRALALLFGSSQLDQAKCLESLALRYEKIFEASPKNQAAAKKQSPIVVELPGLSNRKVGPDSTAFVYVIWRAPWMCVSRTTFIASMLSLSGYDLAKLWTPEPSLSQRTEEAKARYPEFALSDLPANTHLLLSTEPYPFAKKLSEVETEFRSESVADKNLSFELVDGESFSWFGIRALRYLESLRNDSPVT